MYLREVGRRYTCLTHSIFYVVYIASWTEQLTNRARAEGVLSLFAIYPELMIHLAVCLSFSLTLPSDRECAHPGHLPDRYYHLGVPQNNLRRGHFSELRQFRAVCHRFRPNERTRTARPLESCWIEWCRGRYAVPFVFEPRFRYESRSVPSNLLRGFLP